MSTQTLRQRLLNDEQKDSFVNDCIGMIDSEVEKKRGLTGKLIRGAYKTVATLKPGFIPGVLGLLLGEWLDELEPDYEAYQAAQSSASFGDYLQRDPAAIADKLLAVTDRRADKTTHKTVLKLYKRLRGSAKGQVVDSLPAAAALLDARLAATRD